MIGSKEILPRLVARYLELADRCYRVSVTFHDSNGRFRKGRPGPRSHTALMKKADLDVALVRIYERFFSDSRVESPESTSTSTSNSRPQGSETCTRSASSLPAPSRSE